MKDDLRSIRQALGVPTDTPVPAGVGLVGWVLDKTESSGDPLLPTVLEEMPSVIWFAFGTDLGKYISQVRTYDAKRSHQTLIFVIVNSVEEARRAATEWKVDSIVVQGTSFTRMHGILVDGNHDSWNDSFHITFRRPREWRSRNL